MGKLTFIGITRHHLCLIKIQIIQSSNLLAFGIPKAANTTAATSFALRFQTASSCKHRHILNTRPPPAELSHGTPAFCFSV